MRSQTDTPLTPAAADAGADRRRSNRFRCPHATVGRLYVLGEDSTVRCRVEDLSATGIRLRSADPYETESDVFIHLAVPKTRAVVHLVASVMRCAANDDGTWSVGCKFNRRLPRDVLEALVGG